MAGKKDFTQVAHDVFMQATKQASKLPATAKQERGRKGGLKGGVARTAKLTSEQRADIARLAAQARWKKS